MLKYFNLTEDETVLLIKVLKEWYCLNNDSELFSPRVNKLLLKINSMNFKLPQYLYRSYSFEREEDIKKFIDGAFKRIAHPSKDYESWTSSEKIARKYMPGGESQLNKNAKYGIMLRIPRFDYQDRIKFSIENLFKEYNDRKILFNELFKYLSKDLMRSLKDGNLSTKDIQEFQHIIPGMVRAISEYEYMIGPLDYPSPITVATVGIPEEPFRYITMDEIKGYNVRRRRLLATIANKNKINKDNK